LGNTSSNIDPNKKEGFFRSLFNTDTIKESPSYLSYTDPSKRITTYYAYGHDQATGEKQLKNWQVYNNPSVINGESVAYSFTNAKLKKNEDGSIGVYYYGEQEIQNEKVLAEVDPSLMERAQRTLAKEMGDSINSGETPANFTIPKPYYINVSGDRIDLDWRLSMDGKDISIDFAPEANEYPLALDPTLSFTVPAMSNTGDVITGDWGLGTAMTSGDFNADGRMDLAAGLPWYGARVGRVYVFYNDGAISATTDNADAIITGEGNYNRLGSSLTAADFNADGKTDLAVGAHEYNNDYTGRVYIFYNDGSYPSGAASADVKITGETVGDRFEIVSQGDFNSDGKTDLIVGAVGYSSYAGRAYIFYNDGSYPSGAASADIIITGEASSYFGSAFASGDFNNDGKTDISVGAYNYSSRAGRAYVFYNDGSFGTVACTTACLASNADAIITGEAASAFGMAMTSGDFNTDGKTDIAVGAAEYNPGGQGNTGKVYIFYNANIVTGSATGADALIQGGSGSHLFGDAVIAGDFNSDGRTDLAVMAIWVGRAYIFYNDGSYPSNANTADVIITLGAGTSAHYGINLASGDFNTDGKIDLAVGFFNTGRTYIFYSQNGQVNTNQYIAGNAASDFFGAAMITGDFNVDGRTDLAVGATGYNPGGAANTGRVYIFYNDGSIPSTAATADVIITGNAVNDVFGSTFAVADLNADGKLDLVVGAPRPSDAKVYVFYVDGTNNFGTATCSGTPALCSVTNADITITGEATNNYFGSAFTTGDFNNDGSADLAVGAYGYSTFTGRTYIFYNDGSIPTTEATADVTITGEATNDRLGGSLVADDLNADGRIDLAVTAPGYSTSTGRVYVFYNGSIVTENASGADVIITGVATGNFGGAMITGDFNTDGRIDLAVGAPNSSSGSRVALFYNDGNFGTVSCTTGCLEADADITILGSQNYFGRTLAAGDFNADGRMDIAVGRIDGVDTGTAFIYYNDGSIPTTEATADVKLAGNVTSDFFGGSSLTVGDLNADGRTDLIVGSKGYSSSTGRVYLYETRENFAWKLQSVPSNTGGLRTGLSGTGQEMQITGGVAGDYFGSAMTTGDFNADGKIDLAIGAYRYNSNQGRVYIFYADGALPSGAMNADVIITGEAVSNYFGFSLVAGDFNTDGKDDLTVGAYVYNGGNQGRAYIFYGGGVMNQNASGANVILTGESGDNHFGVSLATGDFNADGKDDLAVGAQEYNADYTGRAYIFYGGSMISENASGADVILTGEAVGGHFGVSLAVGDFNANGKDDLVVGANYLTSSTGRAYIFYGGSMISENASGADVILTGGGTFDYFGTSLVTGDFNTDGKADLAVGAFGYSGEQGRAYIFYGGSMISEDASGADITLTGEVANTRFGFALTAGDFNTDGRIDVAVGALFYSTNTGRAYIFYNDGSIPTTAATADIILTGEATSNYFGSSLNSGDFNADGKTDLAIGAYGYASNKGRAYIYTFNDPVITGETTSNFFGASLASGDFNADGKADLAVGAYGYSTNTGRAYIFYNDGLTPNLAASADVIITGEATGHYFGVSLASGDFNTDGKTDLIVAASEYKSAVPTLGRLYIFYNGAITTENASGADVMITGTSVKPFAETVSAGDFNSDGRTDIISRGGVRRMVLIYNDGSYPSDVDSSDVIITAEDSGDSFGSSFASGDFNSDGKTDLVIGASTYPPGVNGRIYVFYGDGVTNNFGTATCTGTPTTCLAIDADAIITGEAGNFGTSLTAGDFNADGKTDFAVGAKSYGSTYGRIYIFYNGAITTENASGADVIINGSQSGGNYFGQTAFSGDFNGDGRTDLVVGNDRTADTYNGKAYIFYNDGSYPSSSDMADIVMTGEATNNYFSRSFAIGDFNADGKTDLVVGAYRYSTDTGRVYMFMTEVAVKSIPDPIRTRGTIKLRGTSKLR
jgi:hypothetical protein